MTDSLVSKNTIKSFNEKITRSISERNDLILNKNSSINVTTSLSFNRNQMNNQSSSLSDTDSTLKLNYKIPLIIDNYKINEKEENLFKRRSLFANSKIKIFTAKDSLDSKNFTEDIMNKKVSISHLSSSLQRLEIETSKKDDYVNNLDEICWNTLQIKNKILTPEWVSQSTLEKIKGNLLDLHFLGINIIFYILNILNLTNIKTI